MIFHGRKSILSLEGIFDLWFLPSRHLIGEVGLVLGSLPMGGMSPATSFLHGQDSFLLIVLSFRLECKIMGPYAGESIFVHLELKYSANTKMKRLV